MKKVFLAAAVTTLLTGCPFDNNNSSATVSPAPTGSPSPTAASSPAPSSSPAGTATPAPSSSPNVTATPVATNPPGATSTPAATATPAPTASNGSAAACYNPVLLTAGSNYKWTLRREQSGGGTLTTSDDRTVASGSFTFNGKSAIKTVSNLTTANGSPSSTDTYNNKNDSLKQIETLGTQTTSPVTVTITFDPARKDSFALAKDEFETQSYMQTIETGGFSTLTQQVSRKRTYLGRETITVPAGSFETCRFKEETTLDAGSPTIVEQWIDVGSGLLVQQRNTGDGDDKLVSGEVNGSPIQ